MPSIALWLALREALHYRVSTLCQIFLVAALAAPLMTILAVQVGVVTDLRHHLERQPENLRLSPSVSVSKDAAWFEAQRRDPRVGFVAPHPYANADELELEHPNGRKLRAALLASGSGDLFLPESVTPPDIHETVMTASIAAEAYAGRTGARVGDVVELVIARPLSGEQRRWPLEVAGISPRGRWASDGLLVHEALLTEAWQWRIGRSSPLLGEDGTAREEPLSFPQFRMFAATLEDLHPLADRLSAEGVAVSGRFAAAEMADAIEHTARIVVLAVAWTATVGAFASLAFAPPSWLSAFSSVFSLFSAFASFVSFGPEDAPGSSGAAASRSCGRTGGPATAVGVEDTSGASVARSGRRADITSGVVGRTAHIIKRIPTGQLCRQRRAHPPRLMSASSASCWLAKARPTRTD